MKTTRECLKPDGVVRVINSVDPVRGRSQYETGYTTPTPIVVGRSRMRGTAGTHLRTCTATAYDISMNADRSLSLPISEGVRP